MQVFIDGDLALPTRTILRCKLIQVVSRCLTEARAPTILDLEFTVDRLDVMGLVIISIDNHSTLVLSDAWSSNTRHEVFSGELVSCWFKTRCSCFISVCLSIYVRDFLSFNRRLFN